MTQGSAESDLGLHFPVYTQCAYEIRKFKEYSVEHSMEQRSCIKSFSLLVMVYRRLSCTSGVKPSYCKYRNRCPGFSMYSHTFWTAPLANEIMTMYHSTKIMSTVLSVVWIESGEDRHLSPLVPSLRVHILDGSSISESYTQMHFTGASRTSPQSVMNPQAKPLQDQQ